MPSDTGGRPAVVGALVATAIAAGAFAGLIAAAFIWLIEEGTKFVWSDLPDRVGVDPFDSWWLFVVPIVGGALVGLCQMFIGNYPRPLAEAVQTWKRGGRIEPEVAPKTAVNSLAALFAGGPVGFEAALTGVIGGTATWIGRRIRAVGRLVRQATGAEPIEGFHHSTSVLPYWLAAVAGLFTYKWLPFGEVDATFRFTDFDGRLDVGEGLAAIVLGALVVVPAAWAVSIVERAEEATWFRRSPIVIGAAGGALFALLAVPNEVILFSGQQGIQLLPSEDTGDLLYVTVAKWAALVIALVAGWRGGPIFPTYTSAAALGVLVADAIDVGPDVMLVAAMAAVGVVFTRGSIPIAIVLTLYPVDFTYAGVILVGCVGGALGLAAGRSLGLLPAPVVEPRSDGETEPAAVDGPTAS